MGVERYIAQLLNKPLMHICILGNCGLMTYLEAVLMMRFKHYWTSTSVTKPLDKLAHMLLWAPTRTWLISAPSLWTWTWRSGTWYDVPRITVFSQLTSLTPVSLALIFDKNPVPVNSPQLEILPCLIDITQYLLSVPMTQSQCYHSCWPPASLSGKASRLVGSVAIL